MKLAPVLPLKPKSAAPKRAKGWRRFWPWSSQAKTEEQPKAPQAATKSPPAQSGSGRPSRAPLRDNPAPAPKPAQQQAQPAWTRPQKTQTQSSSAQTRPLLGQSLKQPPPPAEPFAAKPIEELPRNRLVVSRPEPPQEPVKLPPVSPPPRRSVRLSAIKPEPEPKVVQLPVVSPPPRRPGRPLSSAADPDVTPLMRASITSYPIRAVAVAHENANAVGTVEVCCAAESLLIRFVKISAYSEGYVPYPVTTSQLLSIPYEQVTRVTVDSEGLVLLALDPACTPYNKLALAGLVHDGRFDHGLSHRKRAKIERSVTLCVLSMWMPLALLIHVFFPALSSPLAIAAALTVSGIVYTLRTDIASKLVLFNRRTERVREELLAELTLRLGPNKVRQGWLATAPEPEPDLAEIEPPPSTETGSLKGLFATAGVVAAVAGVAILFGRHLLTPPPEVASAGTTQQTQGVLLSGAEPMAPEPEPTADSKNAPHGIVADSTPSKVQHAYPPCTCARADSPLWAEGIPRLSVFSRNRPGHTTARRPSVYPEVSVVNNANTDLKDLTLLVDFYANRQNGASPKLLSQQALFWEGALNPGQAVKWRVKGRGDDFLVTSFISGMLGEAGIEPAPADAFYKLSMTANTEDVRIHGTKMLAYLGDERVSEAVEKLRANAGKELDPMLSMLSDAARTLRVCSIQASPATTAPNALHIQACVYNTSSESKEAPIVTARTLREGVRRESRWTLDTVLAAKSGAVTSGIVEVVPASDPQSDVHVEVLAEQ